MKDESNMQFDTTVTVNSLPVPTTVEIVVHGTTVPVHVSEIPAPILERLIAEYCRTLRANTITTNNVLNWLHDEIKHIANIDGDTDVFVDREIRAYLDSSQCQLLAGRICQEYHLPSFHTDIEGWSCMSLARQIRQSAIDG